MLGYAWPDIVLAMRPVERSTKVGVETGRSPICRTGRTKRLMEAVLRRTIRPQTNNKAWIHMSGYKEGHLIRTFGYHKAITNQSCLSVGASHFS